MHQHTFLTMKPTLKFSDKRTYTQNPEQYLLCKTVPVAHAPSVEMQGKLTGAVQRRWSRA